MVSAAAPQPAISFPKLTIDDKEIDVDFLVNLIKCWLDAIQTAIGENDFKSIYDHMKRQMVAIVKHELVKCRDQLEGSPEIMRKFVTIIIHNPLESLDVYIYCCYFHADVSKNVSRRLLQFFKSFLSR